MTHTRLLDLYGTNTGALYSLCNEGVDIVVLGLADLNVHAAQDIDPCGHGLPVKGHILGDIQIQILIDGLDGLLGAALGVGRVDLIIYVPVVDVQIRISVYGHQLDLSGLPVNVGDHDHIRLVSLTGGIVPGIHAEDGDGPEALFHLVPGLLGKLQVCHIRLIEVALVGDVHMVVQIGVGRAQDHGDQRQDPHKDPDDDLFLLGIFPPPVAVMAVASVAAVARSCRGRPAPAGPASRLRSGAPEIRRASSGLPFMYRAFTPPALSCPGAL